MDPSNIPSQNLTHHHGCATIVETFVRELGEFYVT